MGSTSRVEGGVREVLGDLVGCVEGARALAPTPSRFEDEVARRQMALHLEALDVRFGEHSAFALVAAEIGRLGGEVGLHDQ